MTRTSKDRPWIGAGVGAVLMMIPWVFPVGPVVLFGILAAGVLYAATVRSPFAVGFGAATIAGAALQIGMLLG